jgi:PAS domain S-box-containing protein
MELSARFVRDYFDAARQCGLSPEDLAVGLAMTSQRAGGRIAWNDFAELTDRIGAALETNARVEEFGSAAVTLSAPSEFFRLVPHLVDPGRVLRIGLRFTGPAVFPHIHHALEKRADGKLRLTLSIPEPYRGSETFFRSCVGGIRVIPTLLGYGPALVHASSLGARGAVFEITPPPNRTVLGRVRSALRALRGESVLFDEIARQHEAMQSVFGVLLRTQSELRQLMERVPDPLVVHRRGIILWTNQAFLAALKLASLDELRGKQLVDLAHPDDRDAAAAGLAVSIGEARAQTFRIRATDGTFRTFELSEPQDVTFDEVPARVALARDVTERDALREQLLLADRMSQLGFLAAGVAHEINNPLAYALAALGCARRDIGAGNLGAAQESLAIALEGAERVRGITNDLRMFTRGVEQRSEATDPLEVVRASVDLARVTIRARAHLVVDLGPAPMVFADAGRLGQVLMNLLVNAVDALTDRDPETSRIAVRTRTSADGSASIEIEDNGHGIPVEVQSRIFEPFFTTKGSRSGSGLGLAICRHIVREVGGRIEVESAVGAGSLFRVVLPPYRGVRSRQAPPERSLQRFRVLVIDDEPLLGNALAQMLRDEHDVEVVTSGEDALVRLEGDRDYDAILCDLMMGAVSGMEVYARLKDGRPGLAKRLIFMTGGAFSAGAQRFLNEAKNPCLDKPFTKDEVIGAMNFVRTGVRETQG